MDLKKLTEYLNQPQQKIFSQSHTVGEKIFCLWECKANQVFFENKYVILGVPDERGVAANNGYPGAHEGPDAFRNSFYKLSDTQIREYNPVTHHPYPPSQKKAETVTYLSEKFVDAGNIILADTILETHENIAVVVEYFLRAGAEIVFVIGGCHDFSYGSYKGHVAYRKDEVIPIINFDAHFDLSPVENNIINSTSAFYRVIQDFSKNILGGKALLEIGIQRERNSHFLYEYAEENQIPVVEYLSLLNLWRDLQEGHNQLAHEHVRDHLDDCAEKGFNRYTGSLHLSLCLDVFNQNIAPGTSASTPMGIQLGDISESLVFFSRSRACRVIDVAELCPPRDFNDQTARLAASLVYRIALVREEYAPR